MIKRISLFRYVVIPKHLSIALPAANISIKHDISLNGDPLTPKIKASQKNNANITSYILNLDIAYSIHLKQSLAASG